jgi:hypothetical protein
MTTLKLKVNADLTHEDAREWYDSYGWHLSTESGGDVTLQAVEYDWLDRTDAAVIKKLLAQHDGLTEDEAEYIVDAARDIRNTAESVESLLVEAVEAYQRGDAVAVAEALDAAESVEESHGDSPAANSLREQLLCEDD